MTRGNIMQHQTLCGSYLLPTYVLDDTGSDPHPKQIWTKALQDRFGNYIVQRVIETCSGAEKEEAGSEIAAPRARKLMDF